MADEVALITGLTVGTTDMIASQARPRRNLGIYNQSTTNMVYVAFDQPAVAAPTAGQLTLEAISATGPGSGASGFRWTDQFVPGNEIHLIASGSNTPVTLIE
jgi:hypothetical protein